MCTGPQSGVWGLWPGCTGCWPGARCCRLVHGECSLHTWGCRLECMGVQQPGWAGAAAEVREGWLPKHAARAILAPCVGPPSPPLATVVLAMRSPGQAACAWHVHGMCMACAWRVHGMHLVCTWHVIRAPSTGIVRGGAWHLARGIVRGGAWHLARGNVYPARGNVYPARGNVYPARGNVYPARGEAGLPSCPRRRG